MISKSKIVQLLQNELQRKRDILSDEERLLQDSLEDQTKSSVGDKYETTRAMLHIELDKLKIQNRVYVEQKRALDQIRSGINERIVFGSVVHTSIGLFLIGPSIGKFKSSELDIMCISVKAPLSKAMWHKRKGDELIFNQGKIEIISVY